METISNPYSKAEEQASASRVPLLLRLILVLTFAGLFVAGALSVGKLLDLGLPCGAAHGCDVVNNHPSSKWFGVPIAYIGFFGYAILAGLAIARSSATSLRAKPLALAAYLISAFGALTSVGLQIYSLTVIQATCRWCLASAAIMVVLLVLHALEYSDRIASDAPAGRGEFKLVSGLGVVLAFALLGFTMSLKKATYSATPISETVLRSVPLVPEDAHIYGQKDSPVTIVEFADLMCPSCQQNSPKVKEFVTEHSGKVRLVYRHFPLQMHPMGTLAAAVAEVAAEDGKFWDFATAIMATGENMNTPDRVFDVAKSVGLDPEKIKAKLQDENGPATQRLTRDVNAANALGIQVTPTFLVQVKGMETQAYSFQTLMDELKTGRYRKMIDGS